MQARAERLEEQVKDLNEARKARQMYEDRMRVMEEQRDKAGAERRTLKQRIEELEAQIASSGDAGDQLAEVRRPLMLRHDSAHIDISVGSRDCCACTQAGAVAEQRAAQMERLQAWLPVMHAQIKKTKGKEKKSFTMVRSPRHSPDCLHLREATRCFMSYACLRFTHLCTVPAAQLMDQFLSIMGME